MNTSELAQLMRSVGFPESSIATGVAIAMGESSGNPRAFNGRGNDESYGLWQINMKGSLGPARRAQFGLSSNEDLFDPAINAKAAYTISSGGSNWRAWGAYTNGSYKRFLTGVPAASPGGNSPSPLPTINVAGIEVSPLVLVGLVVAILILK